MKRWSAIAIVATLIVAAILMLLVAYPNSFVYHPHTEQVAPNFANTEAVRITTEDGESIVAWCRAPAEGQPIFLFFNGAAADLGGRWRRIAESGAGFLAVYYRGYRGSRR